MNEKPDWFKKHEDEERINFASKKDLQDMMDELRPFMQGAAGLGILWKFLIAIGSAVLIYVQIKQGILGK